MPTIQIRIDQQTKQSAKQILDEVGLDMSSAIKVYLNQIVIYKGIPFKLITENGFAPEEEKNIIEASKEAKRSKNVTKAMSLKEAVSYLKKI